MPHSQRFSVFLGCHALCGDVVRARARRETKEMSLCRSQARVVLLLCYYTHYTLQMEITAASSLRINISKEIVTHFHHLNGSLPWKHGEKETAACAAGVTLPLFLSAITHVSHPLRLALFIIDDRWALRPGECWAPPATYVLCRTHTHTPTHTHLKYHTPLLQAPRHYDLGWCACLCVCDAKRY